jgi:hypothetical protein
VAVAAAVGENSWLKLTEPLVAVVQSGMPEVVLIDPPEQKIKDSGIIPVNTIWVAVLAATLPVSTAPPVVLVDTKEDIRT